MDSLIFRCPCTGCVIDPGIQTDQTTLATVRSLKLEIYCAHCDCEHELSVECASLGRAELDPPKASVLTIAINALRIFSLRRGLNEQA